MSELEERRWRLHVVFAIIAGCFVILMLRLLSLQILQHDYYRVLADKEHWRQDVIPAQRGNIWDSTGHLLAASVTYESLYADAYLFTNKEKARAAQELSPLIGEPEERIRTLLSTQSEAPVLIKSHLPYNVSQEVRQLRLWDFYFLPEPKRAYPEGNLAAQLLGIVGQDNKGLSGLEASFDQALSGKAGLVVAERDTAGEEIVLSPRQYVPPQNGADLVLTIDRFIQRLVERELDKAIISHKASGGTIIVMEPVTGAILALASRPTFELDDPDLFQESKFPLFRDPAIGEVYEPGSAFKIITMAAALDGKAVTPETAFMNQGLFAYGGGVVKNAVARPPGMETMTQVLVRSSNIGAAYAAVALGAEKFYKYVTSFGFGQPTGIELLGEAPGTVITPGNKEWYPFALASNAFGQGISVTPLQLTAAVAAVANGGILMKPYLVKEVRETTGSRFYYPTMLQQVISPQTAKTLTRMLVEVVEPSDGEPVKLAKVPGFNVAGKTGTAEIPTLSGYAKDTTIASFVGYAPAEEPRFVMLVKINEPKDSPWGEKVAAPVFRDIAQELLIYLGVPPNTREMASR